jgi:hypothetical protein
MRAWLVVSTQNLPSPDIDTDICRYEWVANDNLYGLPIGDPRNQLVLRCTNCGILFPSDVKLPPIAFEGAVIEDHTYKCPVCANFDTYSKSDLFYDDDSITI